MTATRGPLRLILPVAAGAALLTGLAPHALLGNWRFESLPLHATVEALPAMAAILTALLLLQAEGEGRSELFPPAIGFMAMGILDAFHAATSPGTAFVLLRSLSSLIGGACFALAWLPRGVRHEAARWKVSIPLGVALCSVAVALVVLLGEGWMPRMVSGGRFTGTAVAVNAAAGALYLAAAALFLLEFRRSSSLENCLFACMALLFGAAGLMFNRSALWDAAWWSWHVCRLIAFVLMMGFASRRHLAALSALEAAVAERSRAEDELRRLNLDLERRVAARTAELQGANRELEAFSYSVSHDLRAPLRAIDGFSQALIEDFSGKLGEDGERDLQRVRAGAQRMAHLIDDLLKLSRISRAGLAPERVDLSALARAVLRDLEGREPGRSVSAQIQGGLVAEGDPHLLRILIENLLGNAWKFTGKKARAQIELGATVQDGRTVYFVRDDGAGFDQAYAAKLFAPFQRLHTQGEFDGNGVGLATVARIVQRHGGRAWAEGAVERGAACYFTLGERDEARKEEVSWPTA